MKTPPVRYRLDLSQTRTHRLGVEIEAQRSGLEPVDFVFSQLSPGSPTNSLNHPSRILAVTAETDSGQEARLEKTGPGRFRVFSEEAGPVSLHYTVKADEFSHVRCYLSDSLAYLNGPAALAQVKGLEDQPSLIELGPLPSQTWTTSSTLHDLTGQPQQFYASSYDDIADSNILAGEFQSVRTRLSSPEGDIWLQVNQNGTPPWPDLKVNGATPQESLQDLQQLYKTFLSEFGPFPRQREWQARPLPAEAWPDDKYVVTKHYLHSQGPNAGGYEHYLGHELLLHKQAAASIQRRFDGDGRAHERHIMAHELMHKLVAKFVRHQGIDSADLSRIGSSDGLWLSEGGVEWAAMALQRKSGQMSAEQYQKMLQDQFRAYGAAYAQDPSNARDNSLDAHLGQSGFYNKGAVTCALLDLELKAASGGKGMFEVLRKMKDEFGGNGSFWSLDDVERICRSVADSPRISEFFQNHLRDRKPFDLNEMLAQVGLEWTEQSDGFAEGRLALAGQTLVSNPKGEITLAAGGGGEIDKPVALPAMGITLSSNAKGEVKLVAVKAGSWAENQGLGDFIGQTCSRFQVAQQDGPVAAVRALELEFVRSDPFTGSKAPRSFRVEAQPASQPVLQSSSQQRESQAALRQAWLAG